MGGRKESGEMYSSIETIEKRKKGIGRASLPTQQSLEACGEIRNLYMCNIFTHVVQTRS